MSKVAGTVIVRQVITHGYYDSELGQDISTTEERVRALPKVKVAKLQEKESLRQSKLRQLGARGEIKPHFEVISDAYEVFDIYKGARRRLLVDEAEYLRRTETESAKKSRRK